MVTERQLAVSTFCINKTSLVLLQKQRFLSSHHNLSSVQFSCLVMSYSLWPHGLQHARPPCPSPIPGVYTNSWLVMPSNHLILCCPLLLMPAVFPNVRVFSNESVLHIRCQHIAASASALVLPMTIQGWFPLGLTGLICLQSKGFSRVFSSTTVLKLQFFGTQPFLWSNCHICPWLLENFKCISKATSYNWRNLKDTANLCLSSLLPVDILGVLGCCIQLWIPRDCYE